MTHITRDVPKDAPAEAIVTPQGQAKRIAASELFGSLEHHHSSFCTCNSHLNEVNIAGTMTGRISSSSGNTESNVPKSER